MQPENKNCQHGVLEVFKKVMDAHTPYVAAYRHMSEVEKDELDKYTSVGILPSISYKLSAGYIITK